MKNLKFFAALCCVAAAFAACEKNDPNNGTNNIQTGATGTENGYEWVDLGLSVKWATYNVGAVRPEGYGDYFAWGETEPKSVCSSANYSYSDDPDVLPLDRDAARANWGGAWRMPTDEEWTELRKNCTWTWTNLNGKNGYEVKGANGNSIFLPAAGCCNKDGLYNTDYYGIYWSSSLCSTDYSYYAWYVSFNSSFVGVRADYRYFGLSVRPVCK